MEPGRVALVNYGEDHGKLAVIVDVLDNNRIILDGPTTGITREVYPIKRISLTDFKVELSRGAKTGVVKKSVEDFGLEKKWSESSWGKKLAARKLRANLNDFERFTVMIHRKRKSVALRKSK